MFFQHFIECIFHFNNYEKHEKYNRFPQSERSVMLRESRGPSRGWLVALSVCSGPGPSPHTPCGVVNCSWWAHASKFTRASQVLRGNACDEHWWTAFRML